MVRGARILIWRDMDEEELANMSMKRKRYYDAVCSIEIWKGLDGGVRGVRRD